MSEDAGARAALTFVVGPRDTAIALGSGDVDVLGTPRLLAWCEEATVAALARGLTREQTSVGTRVQLDHIGATPVGGQVTVTAEPVYTDGRLRRFAVSAVDRSGRVVGTGEITRVVVDRHRFLERLPQP